MIFDPTYIKKSADRFSKERFSKEYKDFIEAKWREFKSI